VLGTNPVLMDIVLSNTQFTVTIPFGFMRPASVIATVWTLNMKIAQDSNLPTAR
jgi:hypothetical protein